MKIRMFNETETRGFDFEDFEDFINTNKEKQNKINNNIMSSLKKFEDFLNEAKEMTVIEKIKDKRKYTKHVGTLKETVSGVAKGVTVLKALSDKLDQAVKDGNYKGMEKLCKDFNSELTDLGYFSDNLGEVIIKMKEAEKQNK